MDDRDQRDRPAPSEGQGLPAAPIEEVIGQLNRDLEGLFEGQIERGREIGEEELASFVDRLDAVICPLHGQQRHLCWLLMGEPGEEPPAASMGRRCHRCAPLTGASEEVTFALYRNIYRIIDSLLMVNRRLSRMVSRDPLTGVLNRAFFNEAVQLEVAKAERSGGYILFIMVDIDNFKEVNDTEGHQRGDELLIEVAQLLQSSVRASDMVIRYGGDEFLVVAPRADEEACAPILQRLRRGEPPWPSLSVGCSTWCPGQDVRSVIRLADQRMYRNKRTREVIDDGQACRHTVS